MSAIDDGGPAFPCEEIDRNWSSDPLATPVRVPRGGMTLRDWFAGQAFPAILRSLPSGTNVGANHPETNATIARVAYVLADAMLAARKEGK